MTLLRISNCFERVLCVSTVLNGNLTWTNSSHLNKSLKTLMIALLLLEKQNYLESFTSHHVWYAIKDGTEFSATVKSLLPKPSPLKQSGLEIMITMTVNGKILGQWKS